MRRRYGSYVVAAVFLVLFLVALFAPQRSNAQTQMLGVFLHELGVRVSAAPEPVDGAPFVLLADARTHDEIAPLLSWVHDGGTLIVTDPGSVITTTFASEGVRAGGFSDVALVNDCVHPMTRDVGTIEVDPGDAMLVPNGGDAARCFANGEGAYLLDVPYGDGAVVLLGGASPFVDAYLDRADNAVLANDLLARTDAVVFGPPVPPGRPARGIWASLPSGARAAIVELCIAAVVFAFARGRRLGRPIEEPLVSPIPSGELVHASAGLFRRAHAARYCGEVLRLGVRRRATRTLGLAGRPESDVPYTIGMATGMPPDEVRLVLEGSGPDDEQALIELSRELDAIGQRLGGPRR
jgi:hypothetical protein